ncbi:acyl-CoA dehydrogenase family protein, partial [bacterium]|nr:acyl-CoA dehydrogenase family protein [bacterium]
MSEENKNEEEAELVMDTTKMNAEQISSMEVAESARETEWTKPSFASKLFMGEFDTSFLYPFPEQNAEEKKIGDEFLVKLEKVLKMIDPEEVDRTGELPEDYRKALFTVGAFGMKVPKEYGGLGFTQVNYNRAAQLIASYDGATATLISAHQSIGVPNPLKMFGTLE